MIFQCNLQSRDHVKKTLSAIPPAWTTKNTSGKGGKKEEKEMKRKRFLSLWVIFGDVSKFSSTNNRNLKEIEKTFLIFLRL